VTHRHRTKSWRRLFASVLALAAVVPMSAQFTETAFTVDPGSWLIEADAFNYGRRDDGDERWSYRAVGYVQATRGWTERLDLQAGLQAYFSETTAWREPLLSDLREDARALWYLRCKYHYRGDGEARWALAALPYVMIPSRRAPDGHRFVDLGLILPASRQLSPHWWCEAQVQLNGQKEAGASRRWSCLVSANLQRTWNDDWGSYVEVVADFWTRRWDRPAVSAGVGVTRNLGAGLTLDLALMQGVTREALDWEGAIRLVWQP
jgi:hypothetical protein